MKRIINNHTLNKKNKFILRNINSPQTSQKSEMVISLFQEIKDKRNILQKELEDSQKIPDSLSARNTDKQKPIKSFAKEQKTISGPPYIGENGILLESVRTARINDILPANKKYSIQIKNYLGQVPRGTYNIIWIGGTYKFEQNPSLGRVKIMPGDIIGSYKSKNWYEELAEFVGVDELLGFSDDKSEKPTYQNKKEHSKNEIEMNEILKKAKEGDLVFQCSNSKQSIAIQKATNSTITHVGILLRYKGRMQVLEAVQPVKITPLSSWKNRGKDGKITIKRIDKEFNVQAVLKEAKSDLGKPYDALFGWGEDRIYCSELIYKAFIPQGIEVGKLTYFEDLDLSSPIVSNLLIKRLQLKITPSEKKQFQSLLKTYKTLKALKKTPYWEKIEKNLSQKTLQILSQPVITPKSMYDADNLDKIYKN